MLTGSLVFLPPRHHSKLEFEVEGECWESLRVYIFSIESVTFFSWLIISWFNCNFLACV